MAAIVDTDVSIDALGNIRWTGDDATNTHTVLEFIQFLMDKQDDEQAVGDDLLDITVDTPFDRSTDQIVSLNYPFNIDDTFATHLFDGSVSQTDLSAQADNTLYSGINIIGPVEVGTEYMILQDGKILPAFWGTGINPEAAPSLVFSRHLVKSRDRGADIDGKNVIVLARTLGDQYRRFPATLGTGNSVAAIGNGADIFNTQSDTALAALTAIINTEGFQELDIDLSGAAGQEYYSQWDTDGSVNDVYERTKWISQNAHTTDATGGAPTGTDFVIDNATIIGQAQHFRVPADAEYLTEVRAQIQILAGAPTGPIWCELHISDGAGGQADIPNTLPGSGLARSENVLASAIQPNATGYQEVIFRFNRHDPSDGTDQTAGLLLTDDTADYFAVFQHPTADASNNFSLDGAVADVDATMNQADLTGVTWTAATSDINIIVKSSPAIHTMPGEQMQGINIEVFYDGEAGAGLAEDDMAFWGTLFGYDGLAGGPFFDGEYVTFVRASVLIAGGRVLHDDATDELIVALDTTGVDIIQDNDNILGLTSGATALVHLPTYTGDGGVDLDFSTGPDLITRVGGSFVTDGYLVGHRVTVTGSASNNGLYNVTAVVALALTVAETLTGELNVAATVTQEVSDDTISGGIGIVLAQDDNAGTGEVYLQVISGANPVNNARMRSPGTPLADYADATATLNTRTVIPEYLGTSTGSNIIGAYGIGFVPGDVGASDLFTSLDNAPRTPPNNVTFTVSGLVSGQDRVLVGPGTGSDDVFFTGDGASDLDFSGSTITRNTGTSFVTLGFLIGQTIDVTGSLLGNDGTYNITIVTATVITVAESFTAETDVAATITQTPGLNKRMWLLSTSLTTIDALTVVVTDGTDVVDWIASPDERNWPATGQGVGNSRIRVERDNGVFERLPYLSHNGTNTFTLATPVTAATTINVVATAGTFTRLTGSFLTDGFETSNTFTGSAFTNGGNNAQFTAASVTSLVITVMDNTGMIDESSGGDEVLTSNGWNFLAEPGLTSRGVATSGNDVFMAFIDVLCNAATEAFVGVHETGADRDLFVRVRDGGNTPIKTFESTSATFTSTSSTIAAVRTNDF